MKPPQIWSLKDEGLGCFHCWSGGEEPAADAGDARDAGLLPGSGRSPGGGPGNPPQYSCLENLTDRGTWQATVHGAAKGWND